jgi:hypothetical protein
MKKSVVKKSETASALTELPRVVIGEQFKLDALQKAWKVGETPMPAGKRYIVLETKEIGQLWSDGAVVDTIAGDNLSDRIQEFNDKVPVKDREIDTRNGQPRPPWQLARIVYLIDPRTAARYTYCGSNVGGLMAVRILSDCIDGMRQIQGKPALTAVIELHTKPMKTRHGTVTTRPHFEIVDWLELGAVAPQLTAPATDSPASGGDLNDQIPI